MSAKAFPSPLPPTFRKPEQARHDEYLKSLKRSQEALLKTKRTLDQQYLAVLARLASEAGGDQALLEQIKAQKEQVESGTPCPLTDLRTQLPGTRWQHINSPLEFFTFPAVPGNPPLSYTTPDEETVVARFVSPDSLTPADVTTWKLGEDGKTLLKDGAPDLRLVHPDVIDLLRR